MLEYYTKISRSSRLNNKKDVLFIMGTGIQKYEVKSYLE